MAEALLMDRSLDSLSSDMQPRAFEWLARCAGRGIPCLVIQTSRTLAEHQINLASGASGTTLSSHLPRSLRWKAGMSSLATDMDKADAMDIAPYSQFSLHGPDKVMWDTTDPAWGIIVEECERAGLRSGGRWLKPHEPGHGELWLPWKEQYRAFELARPLPWPHVTT